ncbi:amidase [Thioalkalivibrio sp. HK1]|uniref:amidase n=1 Tax=Thioalkalivibrio sp. HK1 TaxID=1469245 RepID=UPI00046FD031|nr:amidase [Thioalkalivibrio sp. HK1]
MSKEKNRPIEQDIHEKTCTSLAEDLRAGNLTSVAITEHFLARIHERNPRLNAFRLVCEKRALAQAKAADDLFEAGVDLGPLHGIPYAAKDLYDVAGLPTTAGSPLLEDNIAKRDCAVVASLNRAGMVLLGKTNTVQFAYGGVGINHHHGTPHNPWHALPHVPGGSSSGSGVAVAAGMAPMALGSDTGGSVRIPAAVCGITGLKTTVGRVSRAGVQPLSHSLDTVGPLVRRTMDAALVLDAIQGPDADDPTTSGRTFGSVSKEIDRKAKDLVLGVPRRVFFDDCDSEVERCVRDAIATFESCGARVVDIDFDEATQAMELNPRGLIIAAEAYSVYADLLESEGAKVDPVVAGRIERGRDIPAHEYIKTVRSWEALRRRALDRLADIDALLCPTVMIPPPSVEEAMRSLDDYTRFNLQMLRNTTIGNILDLCGLSVPCGYTEKGFPVGLMIYGRPFDEAGILRIGRTFERMTRWHERRPDLAWIG